MLASANAVAAAMTRSTFSHTATAVHKEPYSDWRVLSAKEIDLLRCAVLEDAKGVLSQSRDVGASPVLDGDVRDD